MSDDPESSLTLRQRVELELPRWRSWYPSIFEAARDLGMIRADVCPPSQLLLSNRHRRVQSEAERAHREKWGGSHEDVSTRSPISKRSRKKKGRRR